jgi:hypothetical protein
MPAGLDPPEGKVILGDACYIPQKIGLPSRLQAQEPV